MQPAVMKETHSFMMKSIIGNAASSHCVHHSGLSQSETNLLSVFIQEFPKNL